MDLRPRAVMKKEMLLRTTLIVLGGACLLLVAGGFPLLGTPEVYRSGIMLLLGMAAAVLALWGGWYLAAGQRAQFVFGLVSTFFAMVGLVVVWRYGCRAVEYAGQGGAMWFGAVGMACTAVVGGLFTTIFGYFVLRLMNRRLWLAGTHWSLVLLAAGVCTDYCGEVTAAAQLPSNGRVTVCEVMTPEGEKVQLPFTLRVDSFTTSYYGEDTYSLYRREGTGWELIGHPVHEVDCLRYGDELWALEDLRISEGMPQPYLLLPGEPERLIMRDARPVRSYSAACHIETDYRGRRELRDEVVRVNEPIECKGWLIYLNSYTPMGRSTLVTLQLRRAPGRVAALSGMVGLILCTACWCWWRREGASVGSGAEEHGKEMAV